jgi:hypothetical protein
MITKSDQALKAALLKELSKRRTTDYDNMALQRAAMSFLCAASVVGAAPAATTPDIPCDIYEADSQEYYDCLSQEQWRSSAFAPWLPLWLIDSVDEYKRRLAVVVALGIVYPSPKLLAGGAAFIALVILRRCCPSRRDTEEEVKKKQLAFLKRVGSKELAKTLTSANWGTWSNLFARLHDAEYDESFCRTLGEQLAEHRDITAAVTNPLNAPDTFLRSVNVADELEGSSEKLEYDRRIHSTYTAVRDFIAILNFNRLVSAKGPASKVAQKRGKPPSNVTVAKTKSKKTVVRLLVPKNGVFNGTVGEVVHGKVTSAADVDNTTVRFTIANREFTCAKTKLAESGIPHVGREYLIFGATGGGVMGSSVFGFVAPTNANVVVTETVLSSVHYYEIALAMPHTDFTRRILWFVQTWLPRAADKTPASNSSRQQADKTLELEQRVLALETKNGSFTVTQNQLNTRLDTANRELARLTTQLQTDMAATREQLAVLNTTTSTGQLTDAQLSNIATAQQDMAARFDRHITDYTAALAAYERRNVSTEETERRVAAVEVQVSNEHTSFRTRASQVEAENALLRTSIETLKNEIETLKTKVIAKAFDVPPTSSLPRDTAPPVPSHQQAQRGPPPNPSSFSSQKGVSTFGGSPAPVPTAPSASARGRFSLDDNVSVLTTQTDIHHALNSFEYGLPERLKVKIQTIVHNDPRAFAVIEGILRGAASKAKRGVQGEALERHILKEVKNAGFDS